MNALELVSPEGEDEKQEKVSREDLRRVIQSWKILKGIPTEGLASKRWDQANFARVSKSARILLLTFGDWRKAVGCIDFVYSNLKDAGFSCTLETIVRRSDDYWEELAKGGGGK